MFHNHFAKLFSSSKIIFQKSFYVPQSFCKIIFQIILCSTIILPNYFQVLKSFSKNHFIFHNHFSKSFSSSKIILSSTIILQNHCPKSFSKNHFIFHNHFAKLFSSSKSFSSYKLISHNHFLNMELLKYWTPFLSQ